MASFVETSPDPVDSTQSQPVQAQLFQAAESAPSESALSESAPPEPLDGLFSPKHLAVTIGIISSVLLTAFEAMAVSTAMPVAVTRCSPTLVRSTCCAPSTS